MRVLRGDRQVACGMDVWNGRVADRGDQLGGAASDSPGAAGVIRPTDAYTTYSY
jgi:hypothetical protein